MAECNNFGYSTRCMKEAPRKCMAEADVCVFALKQECMFVQALKERLVERANIIQARHDSETAALVKRQVCSLQRWQEHDFGTAWLPSCEENVAAKKGLVSECCCGLGEEGRA